MEESKKKQLQIKPVEHHRKKYVPVKPGANHRKSYIDALMKRPVDEVVEICPKAVLINNPKLVKHLISNGVLLKHIPRECQLKFQSLCIKYLGSRDYQSNFKYLADEIKIKNIDVCVAAINRLNKVKKDGRIQKNRDVYKYIPKELYSNEEFIKSVLQFDYQIFEFIPEEKSRNLAYVRELLQINKAIAKYFDSKMLKKVMHQDSIDFGEEWQEECLEEIKDKQNVILSSPTGSGKTNVFLEWAKQKQERPIYITAPTKALSNQRWRELQEQGFVVGLETGDIKSVPEDCDFICCTQEIYTNQYVEQENATLIIDEFHYIFENEDRTRTYIDGLHDSKARNILLCSATLGDIDKLNSYINKVSNRDFYTYENRSRLTKLSYGGHVDKEKIRNALIVTFSPQYCEFICKELSANRTEKTEDDVRRITEIAEKYQLDENNSLEYVKFGVAYYYGRMLPKEKLFIEELFEKKLIDTVVGTDALAVGVNFPIENVVFIQLAKDTTGPISKNLFDQLAGRAGRKGYFDEGFVYYCDDFYNEGRSLEAAGYDTLQLYYEQLFAKNESISIHLKPRIRTLLLGDTTIEEEAEYIFKYSVGSQESLEDIEEKIIKKIEYIQNYDLINEVIHDEFYSQENENISLEEELQEKLEDRKRELMPLQEEFRDNIGTAYFDEYGVKRNCRIFKDILLGTDMDTLIERRCKSFQDIIQLRKYIYKLPRRYRKNISVVELEDRINDIDSTVLNLVRGDLSTDEIGKGVEREQLETERMLEVLHGITIENKKDKDNQAIGE